MSLRDEIGDLIRTLTRGDPDGSGFVSGVDPCSDAIIALMLAHATSNEAVERAAAAAYSLHNPPHSWINAPKWVADMYRKDARAAILAALGDTHDA